MSSRKRSRKLQHNLRGVHQDTGILRERNSCCCCSWRGKHGAVNNPAILQPPAREDRRGYPNKGEEFYPSVIWVRAAVAVTFSTRLLWQLPSQLYLNQTFAKTLKLDNEKQKLCFWLLLWKFYSLDWTSPPCSLLKVTNSMPVLHQLTRESSRAPM